jgi:hypothetical protein
MGLELFRTQNLYGPVFFLFERSKMTFAWAYYSYKMEIMGVLSDVFIGSPDQITEEVGIHGPSGRLQAVEGKGLLPGSFLKLWEIVDPVIGEPSRTLGKLEVVRRDGDCMIYSLPNRLVAAMAGADLDRIRQVKTVWLYGGKPPPPDPLDGIVKDWYEEFVDLLRDAHLRGLNVYVWLSP